MNNQALESDNIFIAKPRSYKRILLLIFVIVLLAGMCWMALLSRQGGYEFLKDFVWIGIIALALWGVLALFAMSAGLFRLNSSVDIDLADLVLGHSADALVAVDSKGRIVLNNKAYRKLVDVEGKGQILNPESAFIAHDDVAEAMYRLSTSARDGHPWFEDIPIDALDRKQGDAERLWYRVDVSELGVPIEGYGRITVWRFRDISRDKRSQDNAFLDFQRTLANLDKAPVGFLHVEGRNIAFMNATLAGWLGLDLNGCGERERRLKGLISGEGYALINSLKSDDETNKVRIFDLDFVKSDGVRLPVRLIYQQNFDAEGQAESARAVVINRNFEHGLTSMSGSELEGQFLRLFHAAPCAQMMIRVDGHFGETNALFSKLFTDLNPQTIFDLCPESEHEALRDRLAQIINKQADISPLDVELAGDGFRSARLFFVGIDSIATGDVGMVYLWEITEQKNLERRFSQGQKMQAIGQLAGGIAHDFNNVLTAIIGFSDLLLETHKATDPAFQDIMNIKQNANRAASLVRQLLAFSRQQTLRTKIIQVEDILGDLSTLLKRLIGDGVTLKLDFEGDLWEIKVDATQLEQVIINLAVNARDAMPGGGLLQVRARNITEVETAKLTHYRGMVAADYVLIEIEDNGTGIEADVRDKIFDPFFSTKDVGKGTGLGLSTVYGVVKQSGGFIYLETELDAGTCFRVFFPRHVAAVADEKAKAVASTAPRRNLTGSETILIVEDEDGVRIISERTLSARGYKVLSASSGQEALDLIKNSDEVIDLIISDVVMPEVDGPEMVSRIREQMPDVKVIFISGYAEEAVRNDLDEDSNISFLPKPFSLKQLVNTVKDVFEGNYR